MLKRLFNMFRGFFSLFIKGLEKNNPEALLENEKERLRAQISQFNTALAEHAGMIERLLALSKKLQVEDTDLRNKIKGLLTVGKRELAAELAVRLAGVENQLKETLAQLTASEAQYKELTKARDVAVKSATKKIEELSAGLSDLKIKRAAAELSEMATGMVSELGASGDSLNRIESMVEEERTKAAGRARVASDSIDLASVYAAEAENAALAEATLSQFESELGLKPKQTLPAPDPLQDILTKTVEAEIVK